MSKKTPNQSNMASYGIANPQMTPQKQSSTISNRRSSTPTPPLKADLLGANGAKGPKGAGGPNVDGSNVDGTRPPSNNGSVAAGKIDPTKLIPKMAALNKMCANISGQLKKSQEDLKVSQELAEKRQLELKQKEEHIGDLLISEETLKKEVDRLKEVEKEVDRLKGVEKEFEGLKILLDNLLEEAYEKLDEGEDILAGKN